MSQHRCAICVAAGPSRWMTRAIFRSNTGVVRIQRRRYNNDRSTSPSPEEERLLPTPPPLLTRIKSIWNPSVLQPHLMNRSAGPIVKKPAQSWADLAPRVNLPPRLNIPTTTQRATRSRLQQKTDGKLSETRAAYQPLDRLLEAVHLRGKAEEEERGQMKKYIMEALRGKILKLTPATTTSEHLKVYEKTVESHCHNLKHPTDKTTAAQTLAEAGNAGTTSRDSAPLFATLNAPSTPPDPKFPLDGESGIAVTQNVVEPDTAISNTDVTSLAGFRATLIDPFWTQIEYDHPIDLSLVAGDPMARRGLARVIGIRVWDRYRAFLAAIKGGGRRKRRSLTYNVAQLKALDSSTLSAPSDDIKKSILKEIITLGHSEMFAVGLLSTKPIAHDEVFSLTAWQNLLNALPHIRGPEPSFGTVTEKLQTLHKVIRLQLAVLWTLKKAEVAKSTDTSSLQETRMPKEQMSKSVIYDVPVTTALLSHSEGANSLPTSLESRDPDLLSLQAWTMIVRAWALIVQCHLIPYAKLPSKSVLAEKLGTRAWLRFVVISAITTPADKEAESISLLHPSLAIRLSTERCKDPLAKATPDQLAAIETKLLSSLVKTVHQDLKKSGMIEGSVSMWEDKALCGTADGEYSENVPVAEANFSGPEVDELMACFQRQLRFIWKCKKDAEDDSVTTFQDLDAIPTDQIPPKLDMEEAVITSTPVPDSVIQAMVEQSPEINEEASGTNWTEKDSQSWHLPDDAATVVSSPAKSFLDPLGEIESIASRHPELLQPPVEDIRYSEANEAQELGANKTAPACVAQESAHVDMAVSGEVSGTKATVKEVPPPRIVKVARLMHGLDRVLFNPTVHFLRDPRSNVYTFDPRLENIPTAEEFAFDRLPPYITASRDEDLLNIAQKNDLTFYGSTSTLTAALSQVYFLISGDRGIDASTLSQKFERELSPSTVSKTFTAGARLPAALVVRAMPNGKYAIDNDKTWDTDENVLSDIGRILEKVMTTKPYDLRKYLRRAPASAVSEEERNAREAYRYCKGETLLMRSQLDCRDPRLPGTGTFDIKTRAAMPIRQDRANYEENSAYDIHKVTGVMESFEKEYYDMTRSAFLKYSLQVRIGGMDGIFVAYHNTKRIFGFQYIPLSEMDKRLHGPSQMGAQAFQLSVFMLEKILEEVIKVFPGKTSRLIIENGRSSLKAFVEPESALDRTELHALVGAGQSVDGIGEKPVVSFTLEVQSRLNGTVVDGPVAFESVPGGPTGVEWTIDYTITRSDLNPTAIAKARKGMEIARKRHIAMSTLSLPSHKTEADMVEARKKRKEALVSQAEVIAKASDSEGGGDKGSTAKPVLPEGVLPPHANDYTPVQPIQWRRASGYTLSIRRLARESGARYNQRMKGVNEKKPVVWQSGTLKRTQRTKTLRDSNGKNDKRPRR